MSGISPETIGRLVERYGEKAPPKCRICGADMALGEVGGGRTKWYCDGEQARWMGMEPGAEKRSREQHYSASETVVACGDSRVIELLNAYRELTKCPTRTAINVPDQDKLERVLDSLRGDRESFRRTLTDSAGLMRQVCRYAKAIADRKRCEPWSIIGQITSHGSGVSNAIYRLYGDDAKGGAD